MKEEIKDILELLRDGIKRPVVTLSKYSLDNICELNPNECKKLLEYIENLQSQLKEKEEIIEEAISHIRDCCNMDSKWVNLHYDYAQNEMSENQVDDLLEILSKGENK